VEDIGLDGAAILKWILKTEIGRRELDWSD